MTLHELTLKLENRTARLAVVGLGYVGLPVACIIARAGFQTIGIDIDQQRVRMINTGENPIKGIEPGMDDLVGGVVASQKLVCTTDFSELADVDILTVSVQTPVDDTDHYPRYTHLRSALESVGRVLKPGSIVIIESTLAPGTMQRVVIPTLESATGGKLNVDFYVGHCPERVMPGRLIQNLTTLDRVVGGSTPEVADVMCALYTHVTSGTLDPTDPLTAELVKTTENAYRDVQIAFANEVALICEAVGGDVWKVRELVNKSPGRNMLYPGAGVGGHCIPKDPWLLIANVNDGFKPNVIPAARQINRNMPTHVADLAERALRSAGKNPSQTTVAVLGYAYLENSDDTRDTPTQSLIEQLDIRGISYRIHDPFVEDYQKDLFDVIEGADAVIVMVAHDAYRQTDWKAILSRLSTPILIDGRHILPDDLHVPDAIIRVLGRG
ncbi:MAG: nucleotide sugar dehydrogenase [Aggregatilineales bacterium]